MNRFKPGDKARVIGEVIDGPWNELYLLETPNGSVWAKCCDLEPIEPVQEEESPWISVEDRLPDYGEYVFVALETRSLFQGRLMTNGWCALFLDGEHMCIERKVTHWMPLPAPPKIEELKRKA